MSKLKQVKLPVVLDEIAEAMEQPAPNWKLVREHDGLTKQSCAVTWLEWGVDGRFKVSSATPAVGRSLLMSPFTPFFTWQTTAVTELVEVKEDYIKFKTSKSTYELFKLINEQA